MRPVTAVTEVFNAIQKVKAGASSFCTNFFPVQAGLQRWIDHRELCEWSQGNAAFFLRKDRDFWHLYYCASSILALQEGVALVPALKAERVVADLIGKGASLDEELRAMESCGFRCRSRLVRLARAVQQAPSEAFPKGAEVTFAEASDCPAIVALLEAAFDRYADQLPAPYEIETAIADRHILAVKPDGSLAAFLYFETQGFTSTVRFWVVHPRFKSRRLGSALMRHYFAAQPAVRRFILWVAARNDDAVAKYRHYGYQPDGLVDHVLVNVLI